MPAPNNQRAIITHAVLIGLTPLIPIPVVDDLTKSYFQRRMVRVIAASYGRRLTAEDVNTLAAEQGGHGCVVGCLSLVLIYPLKKIFRKVFYFLEWKRAVDLTSFAYHHGLLLDFLLGHYGTPVEIGKKAEEVRDVIGAVCRESRIKPLEGAIAAALRQSKNVLVSGASLLERSFRRIVGRADETEVARVVESVESEEERAIEGVVDRIQQRVQGIPQGHFDNLRDQFSTRLNITPVRGLGKGHLKVEGAVDEQEENNS